MKLKQEQNVFALLKSQTVSVAKRVTSFIRERNLAGKPLSDNGSMPEFVNYVGKLAVCFQKDLFKIVAAATRRSLKAPQDNTVMLAITNTVR